MSIITLLGRMRLYGRIDRVPGVMYVATGFKHLLFIPVIPLRSYVVFAGSERGGEWRGVPIPLSGISVAAAYLRLIMLAVTATLFTFGVSWLLAGDTNGGALLFLAGLAAILGLLSFVPRASRQRAQAMAQLANLEPGVIDRAYGAAGPRAAAVVNPGARTVAPDEELVFCRCGARIFVRPGERPPRLCARCLQAESAQRAAPAARRGLSSGVLFAVVILGVVCSNVSRLSRRSTSSHTPPRVSAPDISSILRPPVYDPRAPAPALSDVYASGSGEAIDGSVDVARVRATLARLCDAQRACDGATFVSLLHVRRLLAEGESAKSVSKHVTREAQEKMAQALQAEYEGDVRTLARTPRHLWKELRVRRVEFLAGRGEAVAHARATLNDGGSLRYRFWLIKEGGRWSVFDWEAVTAGLRQSLSLTPGLALMPGTIGYFVRAAEDQLLLGDAEGALKNARLARDVPAMSGPVVHGAEFVEIRCLEKLGRHDEALKVAGAVRAKYGTSPAVHDTRARLLLELARYEECIAAEEQFLALAGDDADAWQRIADAYDALGRKTEAEEARRKREACESDPDDGFGRAAGLLDQNRLKEALDLFLKACRTARDPRPLFEDAAGRLNEKRAGRELLEFAAEYKRAFPKDFRARYYEGVALYRLARYAEAERAFREGMERAGLEEQAGFYTDLAYTLCMLGRADEALPYADKLCAGARGPHGTYVRACVHTVRKDWDAAKRDLEFLLEADPTWAKKVEDDPSLAELVRRAECGEILRRAKDDFEVRARELMSQGESQRLLALANEWIARPDGAGNGHYYAGVALRWLGRRREAEEHLRTGLASAAAGSEPRTWEQLGYVVAELGRFTEAHEYADRIVAAGAPHRGVGHYVHANAWLRAGDPQGALRALAKCLDASPEYYLTVERNLIFYDLRRESEWEVMRSRAKGRTGVAPK